MSILIKGMEMPKSCWQCQLLEGHRHDGLCKAANRWLDDDDYFDWYQYQEGDIDTSKPLNCPLVEVPKHGRLIDADALKNSLAFAESTAKWAVPALRAVLMVIDEMPTTIPAEEGE